MAFKQRGSDRNSEFPLCIKTKLPDVGDMTWIYILSIQYVPDNRVFDEQSNVSAFMGGEGINDHITDTLCNVEISLSRYSVNASHPVNIAFERQISASVFPQPAICHPWRISQYQNVFIPILTHYFGKIKRKYIGIVQFVFLDAF